MREGERRGWTAARLLRTALLTLAGLGLAWLIITVSGPRALPIHLQQRIGIGEDDPRRIFREAGQELLTRRGSISEPMFARLMQVAREHPQAADPYMFAGIRRLAANDLEGGRRLLEEARRRDPRLQLARLSLVGVYLRTNLIPEASREIAALVRLVPQAGAVLIPELIPLVRSPQTRAAFVEAFGAEPLMAEILTQLVRSNADPDLVLEAGARQPKLVDGGFATWQSLLLNQLMERGEVGRAYRVWRSFVGSPGQGTELIYDRELRGAPGGPPFNWYLAQDAVGVAERAAGGGMEAEYFGRQTGVLAGQTLVLPAGTYRLRMRAEGSADAQGSRLEWRVACHRGGATLLTMPLQELSYTPKELTGQFRVPAGCQAQTLQLMGIAGEFPARQTVRITDLNLERVGGGA